MDKTRVWRDAKAVPAPRSGWRAGRWLVLTAGIAAACAQVPAGAVRGGIESAPVGNKLAADVRAQARRARPSEPISVLIRTAGPPSAAERRVLGKAGVEVLGVTGDIVAARLCPEALGRVTALEFVRYVTLARALPSRSEVIP